MKKLTKTDYQKLLAHDIPLPYKQVAIKFSKYAMDEKLSKQSFVNKSIREGLSKFGEFLEKKNAIMPFKIDVIDFILENQNMDERTLQFYFGVCMEFVIFCKKYTHELFDSALDGINAKRHVEFEPSALITTDETTFTLPNEVYKL